VLAFGDAGKALLIQPVAVQSLQGCLVWCFSFIEPSQKAALPSAPRLGDVSFRRPSTGSLG
jgi:hypothetical protein